MKTFHAEIRTLHSHHNISYVLISLHRHCSPFDTLGVFSLWFSRISVCVKGLFQRLPYGQCLLRLWHRRVRFSVVSRIYYFGFSFFLFSRRNTSIKFSNQRWLLGIRSSSLLYHGRRYVSHPFWWLVYMLVGIILRHEMFRQVYGASRRVGRI